MAISIKNEAVEKLVREAAALANEGLTDTILHALEVRLMQLKGRSTATSTVEEIMAISHRCASIPDEDTRSPDELLGYDGIGVPHGH
ncbi:MAG: type II toxin-antitoxin system VapB family antitoxin [Pseudomonadota bacterium]